MALIKNHFAVVSGWSMRPVPACLRSAAVAALTSGILLAPLSLINAVDEVHNVPYVGLGEAVIDPARHGRALHAVEHGVEEAAVIDAGDEGRIAQVPRFGRDVERVWSLAVGFAAVAAGTTFEKDLLALLDGSRAGGDGGCFRRCVRGEFAGPRFGTGST